jgi:putrescine carbamoyltransferase
MHATTKLGMNFVHAAPAAYQAPDAWVDLARLNAADARHGSVTVTEDVEDAVTIADFVYTDLWWWVDQEDEVDERLEAFMHRYQVNRALIDKAPPHVRFMHCLPASRGVEVTDEVLDGSSSLAFDQAENRLHAEKAILVWALGPTQPATPETSRRHRAAVEQWLSSGVATGDGRSSLTDQTEDLP